MKRRWLMGVASLSWAGVAFACGDDGVILDATVDAGVDADGAAKDGSTAADAHVGAPDAGYGGKDGGGPDAASDAGMDAALESGDGGDGGADSGNVAPFCKTGDVTCLARLPFNGSFLPYYRSHPLGTPNGAIRNVVLVVHGNGRNANDFFTTMATLAFAADPDHTLVLAPYFQAIPTDPMSPCAGGVDAPAPTDLYWSCEGWKNGNAARNDPTAYSFALIDALVAAAKAAFPTITRVTIAGYSAGAQTVQRAVAGSTEEDATPAIVTRWVVASPSSYLYLDGARLRPDATCNDFATCALDGTSFESPYSGAAACPTYDDYTYGFNSRTGYLKSIAPNSGTPATEDARRKVLRDRYVSRSVVYIVSEGDSNSTAAAGYAELDKGCEATAQGPVGFSFRLQRGLAYHAHATQVENAAHRLAVVPVCGHDQACVFTDPIAQAELFGP